MVLRILRIAFPTVLILVLALILTGFILISQFFGHSPDAKLCNYPMTKWEADGYELYVKEQDKGVLVCHLKDGEKIALDLDLYMYSACAVDKRKSVVSVSDGQDESDGYLTIAKFSYTVSMTRRSVRLRYYTYRDFPDIRPEFIPEDGEIKFRLTATDLSETDIPTVEYDEAGDGCPVYSPGSVWQSDDGKITFCMEQTRYYLDCPVGKATIEGTDSGDYEVVFRPTSSTMYLGKLLSEDGREYDTAHAQEKWQCEYSENSFTAEATKSDRYPVGTVITFSRIK